MRRVEKMSIVNNNINLNSEITHKVLATIYACYEDNSNKRIKFQLEVNNNVVMEEKNLQDLLTEMLFWDLETLPPITSKKYFFKRIRS